MFLLISEWCIEKISGRIFFFLVCLFLFNFFLLFWKGENSIPLFYFFFHFVREQIEKYVNTFLWAPNLIQKHENAKSSAETFFIQNILICIKVMNMAWVTCTLIKSNWGHRDSPLVQESTQALWAVTHPIIKILWG